MGLDWILELTNPAKNSVKKLGTSPGVLDESNSMLLS
jgi:hypothetical protein